MSRREKPLTGLPSVLEILEHLDPASRKRLLANIAREDPKLAGRLEAQLYPFEDLIFLSSRAMQTLLVEIPESTLVLALRNASAELKKHVFGNMSQRQAAVLQDELAHQPKQKLSDVLAAQTAIIEIARRLESEGKLSLKRDE